MIDYVIQCARGTYKENILGYEVESGTVLRWLIVLGLFAMVYHAKRFVSRLGEDENLRNKTGNLAKFALNLWRLK